MIDESKYEGRTEGKWEYDSATIHATAKGGNTIIAEYPCWNYNKDQLITKEEEANLRLMADAPLLLEEVKRLREIIQVQIVTPRSRDFFFRHYGKDDFEERWKEWADGIQNKYWGRKE